jgi:hypothetical protein
MEPVALLRVCVFVSISSPLFCQILQNRPELCGDQTRPIPAPRGLFVSTSNYPTILHYGVGRTVTLQGINEEIQEVCPLPNEKIVVFASNHVGHTINIVDLARGEVADSFLAYDPIMSPDHRWIASRNFYPPMSEVRISEEYLLYDLRSSASENRHKPTPYTSGVAGWVMYPAFPDNAPINLGDIPDAKAHGWVSKSFFWASDSQSLAFADVAEDQLSLVLVLTAGGRPQALTHPVPVADSCGPATEKSYPILENAAIDMPPGGSRVVRATFRGCGAKDMYVRRADFLPAKVEIYEPVKRKQPVRKESAR